MGGGGVCGAIDVCVGGPMVALPLDADHNPPPTTSVYNVARPTQTGDEPVMGVGVGLTEMVS